MKLDFASVNQRHSVEDLLARRGIQLRPSGQTKICPCPIHNQQTGQSFTVYPAENRWYCFSAKCRRGGDVTDLLVALDGITKAEAARILGAEQLPGEAPKRQRPAPPPPPPRVDLARLLAEHTFDGYDVELWEESSIRPDEDPEHDWRLMLGALFAPGDVLWMGEPEESGKPWNLANFRSRAQWLECPSRPAGRVAAGVFHPDSFSRCRASVARSPFVVIEGDTYDRDPERNKAACAALFAWLRSIGLRQRAVIDTGGKSLHGWFDRPADDLLSALRTRADALRIDAGLLDRCAWSPLRLPGCTHSRTGKPARLLFLAK
ncbi:MAG: hypothetical protein JSR82_23710 [Verrucomicrobia bacterium]|nr:hypothetical protein [Verrucomicrobiota bacterium]